MSVHDYDGHAHQEMSDYRCQSHHMSFHLQGLAKLLADSAPQSFKETKFDTYFGRKIAVDASMHIYQFLVRPFRNLCSLCTPQPECSCFHVLENPWSQAQV